MGLSTDPLVQVTNGTKSINVRIPLGTIIETPTSAVDQTIGGVDTTQPYLCWSISGATMNTGSVQSSGSVITGTYGMSISDGAGIVMTDVVTSSASGFQNDNAFGLIQDYELSQANADPNYVIQHMLAIQLDPAQVVSGGAPAWPSAQTDPSAFTGTLQQGLTFGIPASDTMPTGQTRGFNLLYTCFQQYGLMQYNVASSGSLNIQVYSNLAGNAALVTDLGNSIGAVMAHLCILSNQTNAASVKGMAPGGVNAFPPPPLLDLSPTGGVAVAPSTFGAWYPSGYNVIPTPPPVPASLTVVTPTQQNAGSSFAITGTLSGYSTAPTLNYSDDAGTFVALPAGFTVTSTTFSFTNPGLAAGPHTVSVRDANNTAVAVSTGTFTVATATTPVVTPAAPSMPAPGQPFTLSGVLANYASAPALTFADDAAVAVSLPVAAAVTTTAFSFLHPALALGSHTSVISDGTNSGSIVFSVTAIPGGASPNPTVITPASGSFTDNAGLRWTVTAGGQVAVNGVVDATTSNVIRMAWVNGVIWQENASLNWYSKTSAGAAWSAGTTTSPLASLPTITIAAIASPSPNTAFQVTGALSNYGTVAPTLTYSNNGGPAIAFPTGNSVTTTTFSFLHPGMPTGTDTLQVSDGNVSNSISYSVATAGWTNLPATTLLTNAITGLAPATPYDIQVFATNAIGQGPASTILTLTTTATLPAAPTGLTAAAPSNTAAALSWTAPATGTTPFTYHVLQSPHNAGTFVDVGTSATTAFTATGLVAATAYDFEVLAANSAGSGPVSTILPVTTTPVAATIPGAVTGLAAGTPAATTVTLTWTAPATGTTPFTYNVRQSPRGAGTFVTVGTPSAATFGVTGLTGGTAYDFLVFASNSAGNGANSATLGVTTAAAASTLPGAPSAVSASTPASTSIAISWVAPATGTVPAKYTVQYKLTSTATWSTFTPSVGVSKNLLSTDIGSITDVSGNVWTIVGGQVAVGGTVDATTSNVVQLSYVSNLMWQKNNVGNWWSKTSPAATWTGGTTTGPVLVVTLLAGAGGSITDAANNVWTIVGGQVAVGGTIDATTSNVVELDYVGSLMWQKNNAGLWWSKTSPTAAWTGGTMTGPVIPGLSQTVSGLTAATAYNFQVFATNAAGAGPVSSPAVTASTGAASTGTFTIANAQIIAPNGTTFFGKGLNIYDGQLQGVVNNAQGGMLTTLFPHINIIRVPCYSYNSPSSYEPAVSWLTARGIVVLLENHQSSDGQNRGGGTGVVFTGALLQTESNWFAALATAYINNPYVWLGTNNEPPNSYTVGKLVDQGSLTSWQVTTYNAIRGTGNKNPILLQEFGGGLPFAMGKDNVQGLWPSSSYAPMTNVFWDVHQYDWVSGYSADIPTILSTLNTMVGQAQQTTSADGVCPCIIGEYGPSSNGSSIDAGGNQMVTAVHQCAFGSTAWAWASGAASDNLTDGNNNLTSPYGTAVAAFIG